MAVVLPLRNLIRSAGLDHYRFGRRFINAWLSYPAFSQSGCLSNWTMHLQRKSERYMDLDILPYMPSCGSCNVILTMGGPMAWTQWNGPGLVSLYTETSSPSCHGHSKWSSKRRPIGSTCNEFVCGRMIWVDFRIGSLLPSISLRRSWMRRPQRLTLLARNAWALMISVVVRMSWLRFALRRH